MTAVNGTRVRAFSKLGLDAKRDFQTGNSFLVSINGVGSRNQPNNENTGNTKRTRDDISHSLISPQKEQFEYRIGLWVDDLAPSYDAVKPEPVERAWNNRGHRYDRPYLVNVTLNGHLLRPAAGFPSGA